MSSATKRKASVGIAIPIFLIVNSLSAAVNYRGCIDCYGDFGFPIHAFRMNYFPLVDVANWCAFIVDILFAMSVGFGVVWWVNSRPRRRSLET